MSQAHHNALWSSWLVEALAGAGVREVVVSPGSRSAPLALAFAACETVRAHVVLDERAAGFVALGLARASRGPVALVCTSGSAAAHYLPAVMEAHHSRVPLLVLTADRPPELHGVGAPQTVDQAKLFGSYARAYIEVGAPCAEAAPRFLLGLGARAVGAACGSPAGPVHLNCAFREPLWDPGAPPVTPPPWSARALRGELRPDASMLDALLGWARGVARGVIVVGPLWLREPAQEERLAQALAKLSDLLRWPVLVEPASQLRGAGLGENGIASADALLKSPDLGQALAPDGALCLGQTPTSKALSQWLAAHAAGRVALVDPDGVWHDPSHSACLMLQAEPAALCEALVEALGQENGMWGTLSASHLGDCAARHIGSDEPISLATPSPAPPVSWASRRMWLERWRRAERAAQDALGGAWFDEALWEGAIARELWTSLPEGASLHVASSMPIRDLDAFAPKRGPLRVLVSRGTNGIDGTLATAAGEALAAPDGAAHVLLGDLAFLHDAGGLLAAAQLGANLRALVINNGGGGIFGFLPIAAHPSAFERFFLTPQDADLAALCAAAKVEHLRLTSIEGLRAALHTPWRGVQVLELVVDRALNRALHQRAWAYVAASVRSALDLPTPASLP